ncbi:MAG: hypothetical protein R6W96_07910 [Clostridia bacterium]
MDYKDSKWASQILALQHDDGSWGHFHTLSNPTKAQPMTTEQALRRLRILGFTKGDETIQRAIRYMEGNLSNPEPTVFHEKKHDSKTYGDLMLAAWLRLFDHKNKFALSIAKKWSTIIEDAFAGGAYSHDAYVRAYESEIGKKLNPKSGCLANFVVFYQVVLLQGILLPETQRLVFDYILNYPTGMVYIYNKPLCELPDAFASKQANCFLAAIELLSGYTGASEKLSYVSAWLMDNRGNDGLWDMGAVAKDGIHFPLSDSWRNPADRKADCTYRISRILRQLEAKL